jgi:hypothetical protein
MAKCRKERKNIALVALVAYGTYFEDLDAGLAAANSFTNDNACCANPVLYMLVSKAYCFIFNR